MDHRRLLARRQNRGRPVHGLLIAALLVAALLSSACEPIGGPTVSDQGEASAALADVIARAWQHRLERDITARLFEGLPVERLPDLSYEAAAADVTVARSILLSIDAIDAEALDHDEWLSLEILRWQHQMIVEALDYFWHQSTLTPYASPLGSLRQIFPLLPVDGEEDRRRYVSLVRQAGAIVDQLRAVIEGQLERGIVPPGVILPTAIGLIEASLQPASAGPFAIADARLAGNEDAAGDEAAVSAFRAAVAAAVDESVNPALERLKALVTGPVQAAARDTVGTRSLPGGEAYYRFVTRFHTTLEVTPEAVHEIGIEMVTGLESAMAGVRDELGWAGTKEEFEAQLAADPRFFAQTPEEIGERLMAVADQMKARVDRFFLVEPKAAHGVRRLDPALEGALTYGYYQPPTPASPEGNYLFNGSELDQRSLLSLTGLALHELIPGHHFHIARQFENEALPAFRRQSFATAYTEGWGSYASYLGLEAGLADDPYDRYGIYTLEIFLASRLVVDPGMNLLGWDLERARGYMAEHTLESTSQIASETLRYSTDLPGQGLAYQMGKRKMIELRARAEAALGDDFDIRRFHEAILAPGAMPLAVLEKHIDWWIEQERGSVDES